MQMYAMLQQSETTIYHICLNPANAIIILHRPIQHVMSSDKMVHVI